MCFFVQCTQLIPRTVLLDSSGKQLLQWPVEELENLRGKNVHMCNNLLKKGDLVKVKGITAAQVCYTPSLFPLFLFFLPYHLHEKNMYNFTYS